MDSQWFKVLLVEDNPLDAHVFRGLLGLSRSARFDVKTVTCQTSALACLRAGDLDAVVLDVGLAECSGLDTLKAVHAAATHLPIIILSAIEDEGLAIRALQEGAEDYLVKGEVDTNVVERSLRYAIERRRAADRECRNQATLRLLLDQLPALLWTTDRNLRFTSFCGSALPADAAPQSQVIGRTLFDVFATEDENLLAIRMHRRALDGGSASYDLPWDDRAYHVQVEPLLDSQGCIIGCVGVAMDITPRVQAEDEVRR